MLNGASNVQLAGRLMKANHHKLTFMCVVEHTVSIFSNDVSKICMV